MISLRRLPIFSIFFVLNFHSLDKTSAMSIQEPPKVIPLETATCASIVTGLMEMQMNTMSTCSTTMTFKDGKDKAAKMTCIGKCTAINVEILTKEGLLERATLDAFLERRIPKRFIKEISPLVYKCFDLGFGKLNPKEEFCESYSPLLRCLMRAIPRFCDNIKE